MRQHLCCKARNHKLSITPKALIWMTSLVLMLGRSITHSSSSIQPTYKVLAKPPSTSYYSACFVQHQRTKEVLHLLGRKNNALQSSHRSSSTSFSRKRFFLPSPTMKIPKKSSSLSLLWRRNGYGTSTFNNDECGRRNNIDMRRYSSNNYQEQQEQDMIHNDNNNNNNINAAISHYDNYHYDIILNGLNDAQIEAVTQPLQSITRVIAGPGAGKTRVLTCRIAYLLKSDNNDDDNNNNNSWSNSNRILAVTFTKKAASEMQHRLDALLREDEVYQRNIQANNVMEKEEDDTVQERTTANDGSDSDEIFEEVVQSDGNSNERQPPSYLSSRVTLGTFHSICAKILRWNGQEIAKLPSLKKYLPKSTSTAEGGGVATLDSSFAIIDQSEQMRIIKQCLTERGIDLKGTGRAGQSDIRPVTILNGVSQIKSDEAMGVMFGGDDDDDDKKKTKSRKIAETIYPMYRQTLLAQNSLDFDDLILYTRELLKISPEVRERIQKRWPHVLVDEFQDTSEAQLDIVKLLTTSSLLIVGDGDQSIYSWRGAHAESMSDFVKAFDDDDDDDEDKQRDVNTVFLMENYRSTTNIVKAAQKVISNPSSDVTPQDDMRKDMKPMRGKGPPPRVLACADSESEATFVVKEINKMLEEGTINSSSTVALIYRTNAQSRALEAACVAENLQYLVRGSAGTFYSRAEVKDCLCFLRWIYNGRDQSAMIRAMKTPSRGLGDKSIEEFLSYCNQVDMALAESDDATPATPFDVLLSLAENSSPYISSEGIISKRTMNRLVPFATEMQKIRDRAETQTVSDLLGNIIDTLKLKPHFDSISKTSDEFADRLANVNELRGASERYSKDGPCLDEKQNDGIVEMSPLGNFLDDVSLLTDVEQADESTESGAERRLLANLMTIHASKGMEFDCVFLVGNEEGTFPTQRSITEGEGSVELDEERRLCYVAMTRAKTHLVMTWRREVQTFFGQGFRYSHPERSRFLDRLVAKKAPMGSKKKGILPRASSRRGMHSSASSRQQYGDMQRGYGLKDTTRAPMRRKKGPIRNSADFQLNYKNMPQQRVVKTKTKTKTKTKKMKKKSVKVKSEHRVEALQNEVSPTLMDSSLFFPVGSRVEHYIHGEGIVMTPKPVSIGETMKVTVNFKSGMQVDFPVADSGLTKKR